MNTSAHEARAASARAVRVTEHTLIVELTDGRSISVPVDWYPRLQGGNLQERNHWELLGDGDGIHWPELDEDLSVEGLLAGRRSGETERSLARWRERYASGEFSSGSA